MTDFTFADHGSITILTPNTVVAKEWVSRHLPKDATRWAGGVVIEPRYADAIIEAVINDDLTINE